MKWGQQESVSGGGCWRSFDRVDVYAFAASIESDFAVRERKQCPISSDADVTAGQEFGSALADQDAARGDQFAAKTFYAKPLAD